MVVAAALDVDALRERVADVVALVAYSKPTRVRGVLRVTTSNGIPIGEPSQRPEPKSACRPVQTPIEAMIAAELRATGSLSTRRFQGLVLGKTVHFGAPGTRSASAEPPARRAQAEERAGAAASRVLYRRDETTRPGSARSFAL